jgi:uncharacterized membrane protein YccC
MGYRVARGLYGRWRRMKGPERKRLQALADDVKERALELRGTPDRESAGRGLEQASERLADAMVESAHADPEITDAEVTRLRGDLAQELERLASGEISAHRVTRPARDSR